MAVAAVSAAIALGGAVVSGSKANKQAKNARNAQKVANAKVESIKASRQEIVNPYAGVQDLSGMLNNPYAQLGVATKAAEIQMEQSDIALANTLDTLRSTGASAGGATALAQAALQSKKGVAANIEQQEAQNEKLKAQGKQQLNQQKMSEAQRVQSADAAGKQFEFQAQENRTNADVDRASGQVAQAQQNEAQANAASAAAWGGAISAVGSIASAQIGSNTTITNKVG
jgi:hypothetical protein